MFVGAIDPMNDNDKPAALDDEILELSKYLAEKTQGTAHAFHAFDPRMAIATATANAYIPVSLPYDEIEEQMREEHGKRFKELTTRPGARNLCCQMVPPMCVGSASMEQNDGYSRLRTRI